MPDRKKPTETIEQVLDEFLAEQEPRLAARTSRKFQTIVSLLRSYMESYFPGHDGEYEKVTKAGGTYRGTYGPEDIAGEFGMFLDHFMPGKVLCGQETIDAAGTVTRKLGKRLAKKGYDPDAADMVD
jgi:hypothetical protein